MIYTALTILNEAKEDFPEYGEPIKSLENEIRWIGNEWGSEKIEKRVSKILIFKDLVSLSTVEQVLAAAYLDQAFVMNDARIMADKMTKKLYHQNGDGTDKANAFKHIYWSAYATNKMGAKYTKLFTDAHEIGWRVENVNDPEAMKMDFHNNQRGRILGEKYSINELPRIIAHDIAIGNAAVIRDGKSVLSTPEWRRKDEIKKK